MPDTPKNTITGAQVTEVLRAERLVSGDQPSIIAAGIYAAASIRQLGMAVLMVDALGRVHTMPADAVRVLAHPRIQDDELDLMDEDTAIEVMLKQEDPEDVILGYLKRRKEKSDGNSGV
jgi:hypothetical protein